MVVVIVDVVAATAAIVYLAAFYIILFLMFVCSALLYMCVQCVGRGDIMLRVIRFSCVVTRKCGSWEALRHSDTWDEWFFKAEVK